MKNNSMIKATVIGIVVLTLFTIAMFALAGKNGLINREIEEYNETHVEENQQ